MGRPKKEIFLTQVIEPEKIETPSERLAKLRTYLSAELQSDCPSQLYIQDLTVSIKNIMEAGVVW